MREKSPKWLVSASFVLFLGGFAAGRPGLFVGFGGPEPFGWRGGARQNPVG